jgi:hypothetical protein
MDAVLNWSPVVSHYAACAGSSSAIKNASSGHNQTDVEMLCEALRGLEVSLRLLGRSGERQQGGRVRALISRLPCKLQQ